MAASTKIGNKTMEQMIGIMTASGCTENKFKIKCQ